MTADSRLAGTLQQHCGSVQQHSTGPTFCRVYSAKSNDKKNKVDAHIKPNQKHTKSHNKKHTSNIKQMKTIIRTSKETHTTYVYIYIYIYVGKQTKT